MKQTTFLLWALPLVAGCFSAGPVRQAPVNWTIEMRAAPVTAAAEAKWGVARLSQVAVRAPFDGTHLAVRRRDGSIAFDPANVFAAAPSALLRGAAQDAAAASGLFARVVPATSAAGTKTLIEVMVDELALDCRVEGARIATVVLTVTLVDARDVVAVASGEGTMPAGGGDYSAAFSSAFAAAMAEALKKL